MDLKLLLTTFGLVFLAELGDKTQLAAFCLTAECIPGTEMSVFIGSSLALVVSSFIAVMFGAFVSQHIPQHYIKFGAGLFFVIVGIWTLVTAGRQVV